METLIESRWSHSGIGRPWLRWAARLALLVILGGTLAAALRLLPAPAPIHEDKYDRTSADPRGGRMN
jgi:hypothetical protein